MKEHNQDIELIEKFLIGKMTDEEKKLFENRRTKDDAFNIMLKDMDLLVEGIKQSAAQSSKEEKIERLKFYAEVNDMEVNAVEEEKSSGNLGRVVPFYRRPYVLAAAASVALLITVGLFYVGNLAPNNEKLFMAYFEPFDSPGSGLTRGNNEVTLKASAYEAYDNARYTEAIALFNQILVKNDDPIIHLCLGNAQLKLGQFAEAEVTFNHLLEEHSDLLTQAKWYLALTYLKQNKMERAKASLWEISKSSTYGEKARKLLEKLD